MSEKQNPFEDPEYTQIFIRNFERQQEANRLYQQVISQNLPSHSKSSQPLLREISLKI